MTFVLSNMIPQTAYLNRVIWKSWEESVYYCWAYKINFST
ncbi:MAG: DNA/RNA non-specific endonuclease [Bacteriovorax sp.]|nr:DNA/RNA non-specific endonuclease [Bacteriovorax sp.]